MEEIADVLSGKPLDFAPSTSTLLRRRQVCLQQLITWFVELTEVVFTGFKRPNTSMPRDIFDGNLYG